jgi:hypothetical protein
LNVGAGELTKAATEADLGLVRGVEDVAAALVLVAHRLTGQGPTASISPVEAASMRPPSRELDRAVDGLPQYADARDHYVASAENGVGSLPAVNTPTGTSCAPAWRRRSLSGRAP